MMTRSGLDSQPVAFLVENQSPAAFMRAWRSGVPSVMRRSRRVRQSAARRTFEWRWVWAMCSLTIAFSSSRGRSGSAATRAGTVARPPMCSSLIPHFSGAFPAAYFLKKPRWYSST